MTSVPSDAEGTIPDVLRSRMIFAGPHGILERIDDGFVLRMPDQPTFWWGNAIAFDHAPREDDFPRWSMLFSRHIAGLQPASTHRTFSWDGIAAGHLAPFLNAGFDTFENVVLAARPGDPITAPHPVDAPIEQPDTDAAWREVQDLLVQTRLVQQSFDAYRDFIERRIAGWRALIDAGQGAWFGIRCDGHLASTVGVFVEAAPGVDGRRIGRFQHGATQPASRHLGLAGTLVAHATRHAFDRLGADTLLIVADANDGPRRVYEECGFGVAGFQRGLEQVGAD
jgi:ribosomal protein S18 acetylase RimI-like enzyme